MNLHPISSNYNPLGNQATYNKDPSKDNTTNSKNEINKLPANESESIQSNKGDNGNSSPGKIDNKTSLSKNSKTDLREEQKVQKLKQIDAHVKAHEQAHVAAGGPYVRGGPQFSYIIGPDGNRYAVAGEVKIDVSPVPGDPDATIRKAQVIKRAALAPSDPSPQDRAVAAKADQMAMKARIEKYREQVEEMRKLVDKKEETNGQGNAYIDEEGSFNDINDIIQGGPLTLKRAASAYTPTNNNSSQIHVVA